MNEHRDIGIVAWSDEIPWHCRWWYEDWENDNSTLCGSEEDDYDTYRERVAATLKRRDR